jgi:hypothetical protein
MMQLLEESTETPATLHGVVVALLYREQQVQQAAATASCLNSARFKLRLSRSSKKNGKKQAGFWIAPDPSSPSLGKSSRT